MWYQFKEAAEIAERLLAEFSGAAARRRQLQGCQQQQLHYADLSCRTYRSCNPSLTPSSPRSGN